MTPNQSMPEQVLTLEELRLYLSERQEAEHFLATADHDNYAVEKAERRWQEGIWHLSLPILQAAVHYAAQQQELEQLRECLARAVRDQEIAGQLAHPWYGPCDAMLEDGRCAECARVAEEQDKQMFRHKGGGIYILQGYAKLKFRDEMLVIYEGQDRRWWARSIADFEANFKPLHERTQS